MAKFDVILRGCSVSIRYTHKGNFPISTGFRVVPERFTGLHGAWVVNAKGKPDLDMNGKITKRLSELQEKENRFFLEKDLYPTAAQFRQYLKTGKRIDHTFASAWEDFVDAKNNQGNESVSLARNAIYTRVKRYLDEFDPGLGLTSFDVRWAGRWVNWLIKTKKCKQNYALGLCNVVISFLHHLADTMELIHVQRKVYKKLRPKEEDLDIFFHTTDELRMMLGTDLSRWPDLADTRDKYVLQCLVGMRISDLFSCDWDPNDMVIQKAAIKTRETITIPLRTEARELIRRMLTREGGLRMIPEPVYNREIKLVGERCGIDQWVTMVHGKRKFKAGLKYRKHEIMSSHMARATFICQMIEMDVHYKKIMKFTGIKDVKTLDKYAEVMQTVLQEAMDMVERKQALHIGPDDATGRAIRIYPPDTQMSGE
ncbi:MAG: integrase [Bacteroidetes bacterium]|nr:integrase [Bacteroidota bacterium]